MDRRHFVKTAALVPLVAGGASIAWAGIGAAEGVAGSSTLTSDGQLGARYELTLRRVLDGQSPAYSEEFLLADVLPQAVRRFTEFSGDTSGITFLAVRLIF